MDVSLWQGRLDQDSAGDTRRLHQVVSTFDQTTRGGATLIGFCCDEGVRRNHGRTGAALGPDAIRRALANLPVHQSIPLTDAGNIHCAGDQLESAHIALGEQVAHALAQEALPIVLGGGHEVAFGTFLGLTHHLESRLSSERLLIVNFDAHFDLREGDQASSGTPFRQMADWCAQRGIDFNYLVYGISRLGNTPALFSRANALGVTYHLDSELALGDLNAYGRELQDKLAEADHVYLTIDLDVLPAEKAPGVSAPAAYGMALEKIEYLLQVIRASGKLRAADIAEYNPNFDRDGITAKVAARLVHHLLQAI